MDIIEHFQKKKNQTKKIHYRVRVQVNNVQGKSTLHLPANVW